MNERDVFLPFASMKLIFVFRLSGLVESRNSVLKRLRQYMPRDFHPEIEAGRVITLWIVCDPHFQNGNATFEFGLVDHAHFRAQVANLPRAFRRFGVETGQGDIPPAASHTDATSADTVAAPREGMPSHIGGIFLE